MVGDLYDIHIFAGSIFNPWMLHKRIYGQAGFATARAVFFVIMLAIFTYFAVGGFIIAVGYFELKYIAWQGRLGRITKVEDKD